VLVVTELRKMGVRVTLTLRLLLLPLQDLPLLSVGSAQGRV
jgi:hypothetical protein